MNIIKKISTILIIFLVIILMGICFEIGQKRVDIWEIKNDRIGEGLR